jgi:hypothetical protein
MSSDIGFDRETLGVAADDDHRGDAGGPIPAYSSQPVMDRNLTGQTTGKVVSLADVVREPTAFDWPTEDIDPTLGFERQPEGVVVEFIRRPAFTPPKK